MDITVSPYILARRKSWVAQPVVINGSCAVIAAYYFMVVADWWLSWFATYTWQWKWSYVIFIFCRLWWNRKHHVLRMWWPRSCWTQVTFAFCFPIAFCCTLLLQHLQLGCHIFCSYVALQCCIEAFVYRPFNFSMVFFF